MAFVRQHPGWSRPLGFVTAYLLFTTMLFFLLTLLQKVSFLFFSYIKIMLFTLAITMLGISIKKMLQ